MNGLQLTYLGLVLPYSENNVNYLELLNEFIISFLTIIFTLYSDYIYFEEQAKINEFKYFIGWVAIFIYIFAFGINAICITIYRFIEIKDLVKL
jgi:hypothetical protein